MKRRTTEHIIPSIHPSSMFRFVGPSVWGDLISYDTLNFSLRRPPATFKEACTDTPRGTLSAHHGKQCIWCLRKIHIHGFSACL